MAITPLEVAARRAGGRRGADILLEILESEGVRYIFGNPGTTELPLIDALQRRPDLKYILALQEASVVAMADGYAQAAGRPGFLNLHTAGGLGHGMGNLLNASVSQTPLVVTAGQQDSRHTISDPLLFGDLVSIATPAVKWAQEVLHADQLPVLVRRAFNDSMAAPSGPVFLSLPMDVMEEASDVDIGFPSVINRDSIAGGLPELARALATITPGRLAIIAGDEVHGANAAAQVAAVAEVLGAPVYGASWPSRIPFATSCPLWAGNMPTRATDIARRLADYDAIFALGGKSLITILYSEGSPVPPGCAVYQVSADARDLGRTFQTPLSLVGNIRASLEALLPLLVQETRPRQAAFTAARDRVVAARAARQEQACELVARHRHDPVVAPCVAAYEAVRAIGPAVAIVDEAIATSSYTRMFLDSDWAAQYSFLRGGALGWGMPAAVGASLGLGREPVVCLVGDGAALYSPQALWTAAHEQLPVTFVVMNNREYNVLKGFMRGQTHYVSAREGNFLAMDLRDPPIDYQAMAMSYGLDSRLVTRADDIAPVIEAAMASGRPNLVEIVISTVV
ncbi:acetolactate synthase [Komagataeibacter rhaeticus]|uniref:thiamine pyrophosphate-binding protein n=1 Tax=Komagataeibacter rhaeticus TaxID=215221 RepID=UPI0004D8725E|nr:thiamine pyrophosphate-binding protein [Komagataeibacter rhaeticus]KDU94461.1 acetolactate synthase [Komagataeibacter rhaeticus AF1]MBL7240455.1 thiamine pyrophosphate-binding protein [Komagataeibacter rhaeticus]PYD53425.1 acetolactate synthase [Komagataeibacter rhaeticus]GBQ18472.1 acetolactate synthase large subunit [Komagataeibacter rhaeticus DSM 16663]